ncbi:MAG: DUF5687 family protein [Ginsengibacter sp.]
MFRIFLGHQIKSFSRSRNQAGNIVMRIVMFLLILYFLVIAIAAGFFLNKLIASAFPGKNVIEIFYGFILYYFLADFLMRMQLQDLPTLSIVPYLHLNIRKKTLVNFLNIKSLFSAFNLIPILLFVPFTIMVISKQNGVFPAFMIIVSILSLMFFNNFLVLYLKRKSISNILYLLIGIIVIGGLSALEFFKIISIAAFANKIFSAVVTQPLFALGFTFLAIIMFVINSRYLRSNLFTEELSKKEKNKTSTDYPFLNRFGKTGELAALELKLILRHKRPRNALMMGLIFLLYGFIMYKPGAIASNDFTIIIFGAFFMTGIFIISYGQFMFGWQSGHFDGILTNKVNFRNFIKAKFLLFTLASSALTLLSLFYGFMSWKLLVVEIALYFYNIGFSTLIVLFFAMYNYKRLDLSKGASFNWQGSGASQWLMSIPLLLFPFLIYLPFHFLKEPFWGIAAIGIFGIITLLMRNVWINLLTKKFEKQRYKIAEGFRE